MDNEKTFKCPSCGTNLLSRVKAQDKIIIYLEKNEEKSLILLSPNLGENCLIKVNEDLILREGEMFDFTCPICFVSLYSKENPELCCLLIDDDLVYFTPVYVDNLAFIENLEEIFNKDNGLFQGFHPISCYC